MNNTIKALIAKAWKDEFADLDVGRHYFDDEITVRVRGTIEKCEDQMIAPTVSIPLIPTLAYFWERCGLDRDEAMAILREAITDAMRDDVEEHRKINLQIEDVKSAIEAVKKDLIAKLPLMPRAGRVIMKDLSVLALPVRVEELVEA